MIHKNRGQKTTVSRLDPAYLRRFDPGHFQKVSLPRVYLHGQKKMSISLRKNICVFDTLLCIGFHRITNGLDIVHKNTIQPSEAKTFLTLALQSAFFLKSQFYLKVAEEVLNRGFQKCLLRRVRE